MGSLIFITAESAENEIVEGHNQQIWSYLYIQLTIKYKK